MAPNDCPIRIVYKTEVSWALRDSGFVPLPITMALFDCSHYIKNALGFQSDVIQMLKKEEDKKRMFAENWIGYVGVLFDEV